MTEIIPSGAKALISSQERDIVKLKSTIRGFSGILKAQAAEYDCLASQYKHLTPKDVVIKGETAA